MDPTGPVNNAIDHAATFGPEVFLAIAVMLFCGGVLYLVLNVVRENTRAITALTATEEKSCDALKDHDNRTGVAVQAIQQMLPILIAVNDRQIVMHDKLEKLLWMANPEIPDHKKRGGL